MSAAIPTDLDAPCSRHVRWRQLVACGETWHRLDQAGSPCANLPLQPETWEGLRQLACQILDPVVDRFGPIELTYGFAGPELVRHIRSRIAPALDQHAGWERNRRGEFVCSRLGQACDLRVPGVPSDDVARWVMQALPFDRLYFYGAERPIHVSWAPERTGEAWEMVPRTGGARVPRRWPG